MVSPKEGGEEEMEREGERKREKRREEGLVMGEKKGMALCRPPSNRERQRREEGEEREERAVGSSAPAGGSATGHRERKEGGRDIGRNNGDLVPIPKVERDRERGRKRFRVGYLWLVWCDSQGSPLSGEVRGLC